MPTGIYKHNHGYWKGKHFSDEHRKKLSLVNKGKKLPEEVKRKIGEKSKGRRHTEKAKKKMSESNKGKVKSKEHKRKISLALKGRKQLDETLIKRGNSIRKNARSNPNFGMKGKHHSEETKQKLKGRKLSDETRKRMSESRKGNKLSEETKQKIRISTIEYIKNTKGKVSPRQGRYEKEILDELEGELGYKIIRQFFINGYYLDGYCQELNLAIEIDEEYHYKNEKLRERDINKQNNIVNSLNCEFLRLRIFDVVENNLKIKKEVK